MSTNGLRDFSFHADDEASAAVVHALQAERPGLAAFALAPAAAMARLDPETAARQHLEQVLATPALPALAAQPINGTEPEFKILGTEAQPLTKTIMVKFRQNYNKIPVYGSLVTVELDDRNELLAIKTSLGEPANVDPVAAISPAQALITVRALAGYSEQPLQATPRLYFYFDPAAQRWRLVYIFEDVPQRAGESAHVASLMDYIIDAHTGELVARLPRSSAANGFVQEDAIGEGGIPLRILVEPLAGGKRRLSDPTLNIHTYDHQFRDIYSATLPGRTVVAPPDPWATAAVSAHANAAEVVKFLRRTLQRNGIDNMGGRLISSVNCVVARQSPDGREWRNAAWFGSQMVYGQRTIDGQLRSYAVGLDVVAHEIFHGVTAKTARLQYAEESGALNESYSDIFGVIISNSDKPDLAAWNWEMGEALDETGIPLRDLKRPTRYNQPAHMDDYVYLPNTEDDDNGGVHINSGIHNKAAYNLMTAKNGANYIFTPQEAAILFYLALTQYLSRTSLFSDSRRAVELVARTLFRNDAAADRSAKLRAVSRAFAKVGIS